MGCDGVGGAWKQTPYQLELGKNRILNQTSVLHRPDMSADRSKSVRQDPDPTCDISVWIKLSRSRPRVSRSVYK